MASSISAVGSLFNSSNLRVLKKDFSPKGSISHMKCCWITLQSCQKPERSFSLSKSSSNDLEVNFERRKVMLLTTFGFVVRVFKLTPEDAEAVEYADRLTSETIFGFSASTSWKGLWKNKNALSRLRRNKFRSSVQGHLLYDLRVGSGPTPKIGETVVVDWDGYTIGYYGHIFEARNKTKGGSFEGGDKDFFKFTLGSQQVIPAFEEAVSGMSLGSVRRIIVPPELGYPENDYSRQGPRPTTFSGQRALDFVLKNQGLIDKTLLFDIELLKIIPN